MEEKNIQEQKVNGLFEALAKFQGECPVVEKSKKGAWGYYADLAGIWKVIRAPLSAQGLSLIQYMNQQPDGTHLVTQLNHKSGECIISSVKMEYSGKTVQQMGAVITYYRRYGLSAMLGISSDDDVDDVDNPKNGSVYEKVPERLTPTQIKTMYDAIGGKAELRDRMLKIAGVETIEEIPPSKFSGALSWVFTANATGVTHGTR